MTGIQNKFDSLHLSNKFSSVNIVDGIQPPILGNGVVHATPSLTLNFVICSQIFCQFILHQSIYQTK